MSDIRELLSTDKIHDTQPQCFAGMYDRMHWCTYHTRLIDKGTIDLCQEINFAFNKNKVMHNQLGILH